MSEIINLRNVRKAKHRAEAANEAEANRLRYGRNRAERTGDEMRADKARRLLDGAHLAGAPRADDPADDGA